MQEADSLPPASLEASMLAQLDEENRNKYNVAKSAFDEVLPGIKVLFDKRVSEELANERKSNIARTEEGADVSTKKDELNQGEISDLDRRNRSLWRDRGPPSAVPLEHTRHRAG